MELFRGLFIFIMPKILMNCRFFNLSEALHRIMRVLYGFLTSDQFNKLLRRLNIHNRSQVTYDVFMACFEDAEVIS